MTPNAAAAKLSTAFVANPTGRVGVVSQAKASTWETFWAKVYSYDTPNEIANRVIVAGDKVVAARTAVANGAKQIANAVPAGVEKAVIIIVLLLALYLFLPRILSRF